MMETMIEAAARAFALGIAAATGFWAFRVRSPQTRHFVWTIVLGVSMALPFVPSFETPETFAPLAIPVTVPAAVLVTAAPVAAQTSSVDYLLLAYAAMAGYLLIRLLTGLWLTWNLARRATPIGGGIRVSEELRSPVTFASTILLPANYTRWTPETLEAVLQHEGEHCRRGDFYTQFAGKLYRAAFWFNPLSWYMIRQLADLAEQICDDAAVSHKPESDRAVYAELLVAFASKSQIATECAVAMARVSAVGRRVDRLLDAAFEPAKRLSAAGRWRAAALLLPAVAIAGLSTFELAGQTPPAAPAIGKASTLYQESGEDAFVVVQSVNSVTMMGSDADIRRARSLRDGSGKPFLWIRHGNREYMTSDATVLSHIHGLFEPQKGLGHAQAELGEEQAALGKKQGELGERQTTLTATFPQMGTQIRKLTEELGVLQGRQASRARISELQAQLSELQSKLGDAHSQIAERQAEIGRRQAELGEQQAALGKRQAKLGEQQAEASKKAMAELKRTVDRLVREGKVKPVN